MTEAKGKQGGARVRVPPPLVFLTAVACETALRFVIPLGQPGFSVPLLVPGAAVLAAGLALGGAALGWFRRTKQDPKPWTPSPELILQGPYRYSRNPIYVAMMLVTAGIGVGLGSWWTLLLAPGALLAVHFLAVLPEERYLAEQFGERYLEYKSRVRRYL